MARAIPLEIAVMHAALIVTALVVVVVLVGLAWGCAGKTAPPSDAIDPHNSTQIGVLIGMTGGTIEDAAVARYALERFEQQHGRKAAVKDMATVAGIMRGMR